MSDQEFNEGHIIEGVDRCFTVITMIDELLLGHPAVIKTGCSKNAQYALNIIHDIGKEISALDDYKILATTKESE